MLWLLLTGCAPTACEKFLDAKAACYEKAGMTDDAPADYCDERDAQEDPAAIEAIYDCYRAAYEASACATEEDVAAAGAEASACSIGGADAADSP